MTHGLFVARCAFGQPGRIVKANMNHPRAGRERRTRVVRRIAHGDNVIKVDAKILRALARVSGDINANLGHRSNRQRVHAVRRSPRRIRLDLPGFESLRPTLGHLAPARVAGAQEEHARQISSTCHCTHRPSPDSMHQKHPRATAVHDKGLHIERCRKQFAPASRLPIRPNARARKDAAKRPRCRRSSTRQPPPQSTPARTWRCTQLERRVSDPTVP